LGYLTFFIIYWMATKPEIAEGVVGLQKYLYGWFGYALSGALGIIIFCGFWWFTGKIVPSQMAEAAKGQSGTDKVEKQASSPTADEIADAVVKKIPRQHDVQEQLASEQLTIKDKVEVTTTHPSPRTKQPTTAVQDNKPPTLLELFTRDFPNTMKVADDSVVIQWKDTGGMLHIKRQLYLDFPARAKFVGFYIPTSGRPFDDTAAAVACIRLAEDDAVQKALIDIPKKTIITGGSTEQMTNAEDLTFSGRVFLYHDDFLSIPQKAAILQAFAAKKYDVTFMGTDHLRDATTAWYQEKNKKAAYQ
jgi:hypothetical protein